MKLMDKEPTSISLFVSTALTLAVSFGLNLTEEQILGFVTLANIVTAWVVRRAVYSENTVQRLVDEAANP